MAKKISLNAILVATFVLALALAYYTGMVFGVPAKDIGYILSTKPDVLVGYVAVFFVIQWMLTEARLRHEDMVTYISLIVAAGIIVMIAGPQMTVFSTLGTQIGIFSSDIIVAQSMGLILVLSGVYAVYSHRVFKWQM